MGKTRIGFQLSTFEEERTCFEEIYKYQMSQFSSIFEKYLLIRRASGISEQTLKNEMVAHKRLWKTLGKDITELQVTASIMREYALQVNLNESDSINTKRLRISALIPFYKTALAEGWILSNPLKAIKIPRREHPVPIVLNIAQMKSLMEQPNLNSWVGLRDRAIMELMWSSGLRANEIIELPCDAFSEDYRRMKITGKGLTQAVLPVGKMASGYMKFYHLKLRTMVARKVDGAMFVSANTGEALQTISLNSIISKYGKKADIKGRVFPHCFRYSVATHLSEDGADIRYIQEFLRHTSLDTTSRYIRMSVQRLKQVHGNTHPREIEHE
jgi:site-specific recombinase XerD